MFSSVWLKTCEVNRLKCWFWDSNKFKGILFGIEKVYFNELIINFCLLIIFLIL